TQVHTPCPPVDLGAFALGPGDAVQGQYAVMDPHRCPVTQTVQKLLQDVQGVVGSSGPDLESGQVHHRLQRAAGVVTGERKVVEVELGVLPTPQACQVWQVGVRGDQRRPVEGPSQGVGGLLPAAFAGEVGITHNALHSCAD